MPFFISRFRAPATVLRVKTPFSQLPALVSAVVLALSVSTGWAVSPRKPAPNHPGLRDPSVLALIGEQLRGAALGAAPAAKPAASSSDDGGLAPVFLDRASVEARTPRTGRTIPGISPFATALAFVRGNRDLFRIENPERELRVADDVSAPDGRRHLRFEQRFGDLPVRGSCLAFHFDADGVLYAVNGRYAPGLSVPADRVLTLTEREAVALACETLSKRTSFIDIGAVAALDPSYTGPSAELMILADRGGAPVAWRVDIRPNLRERWHVFIDACDGSIIEAYNTLPSQNPVTATARDALGNTRTIRVTFNAGKYYLEDSEANISTYDAHGKVIRTNSDVTVVTSPNNTWKDSIAVSAHANARDVYDYYLARYNRDGVDGKRMLTPLIVHYTEDGTPYDNAFWAGGYMAFGDARPFARALDVVAHELTHGVIQFTAGLDYKFQPGAINEGLADVMACMVDPDWLLGEDIPGGPFRDLEHPENYGIPGNMSGYKTMPLSQDNGGVHENMGIPSRAFQLLASAIGRDGAARIVYLLLDALYLTPEAQFVDLRLAAVQASTDLFGASSQETAAVKSSFDAVGIMEGAPTAPPVDQPAPQGGSWVAFVDGGAITLMNASDAGSSDVIHPSRTNVYTGTARPISVSKDGGLLFFVDAVNNIRIINLDTNTERLVDNAGEWSSVALSPDGKLLAATTVYADTTIYVFNLDKPELSKAITLYTPSTEGMKSPTAIFADALDWDSSSSQILYDVFHSLPVQGGGRRWNSGMWTFSM